MTPNELDMHPVLHERYLLWKFRVNEEIGLRFVLTCVLRLYMEQEALFAQGRKTLSEVNGLRKKANMPPIAEKENKYQVTWTMNSKHFPVGGKSRAFDFALLVPGKKVITWDTKWDEDHDGIPEYLECARLAKECGLESGAFWTKPDFPHVQLPKEVV